MVAMMSGEGCGEWGTAVVAMVSSERIARCNGFQCTWQVQGNVLLVGV